MPPSNYDEFCAISRVAEILGERWTLLILRELLLGPKRFTDLKLRLTGITSSVLTDRLEHLTTAGVVTHRQLPPPTPAKLYDLTEHGRGLQPAMFALVRWGAWFLFPQRDDERVEPEWLALLLSAYARSGPGPAVSLELRVGPDGALVRLYLQGGPVGTQVHLEAQPVAAVVAVQQPRALVALLNGAPDALDGFALVSGDPAAVADLPALFDVAPGPGAITNL